MSNAAAPRFLTRRNVIFLLGIGLGEASMSMSMVQVPVYLRELGASITDVGIFFTISLAFPILVRIFGGWLADTIGQLRVIFLGSLAGILTFAVYAAAPTWQAALLAPALLAVTTALTFPAFYSYIAAQSQESARGRAYGLAQTIRNLAWVVAPPLGGFLAQSFGYRSMFATASAFFGLAAVIFVLLIRSGRPVSLSGRPKPTTLRASLGQLVGMVLAGGLLTWLLVIDALRGIGAKLSFDLMPVYLSDIGGISAQGIGVLDGIYGLSLLATVYPAGWLVDKTRESVGLALGFVIVAVGALIFPFSAGFAGFAASWMLLAVGEGFIEQSGVSLVSRAVPEHLRGITFGFLVTSLSIFSLPAPWLGSQAWTRLGHQVPFLLSAAVVGVMAIPAWLKLGLPRRTQEPPTRPIGRDTARTTVTVLSAGLLPADAHSLSLLTEPEQDLLTQSVRILREHGGIISGEDGAVIWACFGLAPRRSPPQVSAMLATHAGLAIIDQLGRQNRQRREHGMQPLALGVGIATGEASAQVGLTNPAQADWLEGASRPVQDARWLLQLTQTVGPSGVLISEDTYRYLASVHGQFMFGASGPVDYPGGGEARQAYLVLGRTGPLGAQR